MGRYRTHLPKPPTAAYLRNSITTVESHIAYAEANGYSVAAEWERGKLARLQDELARAQARETAPQRTAVVG